MTKYTFNLDGAIYKGLFLNDDELEKFIEENEEDGTTVEIIDEERATVATILQDEDFEYSYKVEMIGLLLIPNMKRFHKVEEIEEELKKMDVL